MNAIRATSKSDCCSRTVMLLADGELDPAHVLEAENHLAACAPCRGELDFIRAMRKSLRQSCARRAGPSLEARARAALIVERASSSPRRESDVVEAKGQLPFVAQAMFASRSERGRARWAMAGAVTVAACFVLVVVVGNRFSRGLTNAAPLATIVGSQLSNGAEAANDTAWNFDAVVDQLVSLHANPLPPEEKNPEELNRLEPYVGVPVKRSALSLLRGSGADTASFDGARLHAIRDRGAAPRNAAILSYKVRGHRLTVYVFDSRLIPMNRTRLKPRLVEPEGVRHERREHIAAQPVYVGNVRGFSIAAREKSGVGYALASDLDEDNTVQMVASF